MPSTFTMTTLQTHTNSEDVDNAFNRNERLLSKFSWDRSTCGLSEAGQPEVGWIMRNSGWAVPVRTRRALVHVGHASGTVALSNAHDVDHVLSGRYGNANIVHQAAAAFGDAHFNLWLQACKV